MIPEQFADMWHAGAKRADMAAHFGVSVSTIDRWRRSLGLRRRYGMARETLAPLWAEGLPVAEIAQRLGVSIHTVWSARKRFGLPPRIGYFGPPKRKRKSDADRIAEQLPDGLRPEYLRMVKAGETPKDALRRLYAAVAA